MDKKALLLSSLLCLLGACAIGLLWLAGGQTVALSSTLHEGARGDALAVEAAAPGAPTDADLPTAATGEIRATAATASGSLLPLPEDAQWIAVRVVDRDTREPVAGIGVGWVTEAVQEHLEDLDPTDPDMLFVWQSLDLQIERAGWRTTTDGEGIARVTWKQWTTVVAADAGRYGKLQIHENTIAPPGGYVLELGPDLELAVQVLDESGQPAAHVLLAVGVYRAGELQHFWGWGANARTEAPDGIGVLRHLQLLAEDEDVDATDPAAAPRWRVRTYLPGFDDPGIEFSLEHLPTEPLVLRLPACGRVRVRAELAGRPAPGFVGAGLSQSTQPRRGWDPGIVNGYRVIDADGWARFAHVPLGREYVAASYTNGHLSTCFVGPIARGQEVTVVVTPDKDGIVLGGRLVDAERQAVQKQSLQLEAQGPRLHTYVAFRTDDDGRFLVHLGGARDDNRVERLRFELDRRGQPPLQLELPPRTLRPGLEDLGELVLSGGELVVGGRFVDDRGPYTKEVPFWIQRFEAHEDPEQQWQTVDDTLQHQDGTGRFEVRGTVAPGRMRLAFSNHGLLPMEPIEFEAGASDLQIHLATGHALAATLLVHKGTPDEGLYAVLSPAQPDPDPAARGRDEDRYRVEPWGNDGGRSHLQWPALPAGRYALALHLWTRTAPLLVIPDISVPGPDGGDARLADIDLRPLTRLVLLSLFDHHGAPIDSSHGAAFASGQDPGGEWQGTELYEATTKVLVPAAGPTELLVAIGGYRPRTVPVIGDRVDVRLDPWPTLELVVAGMPTLPPKVQLRAQLRPVVTNDVRYRAQWSSGHLGELFDVSSRSVVVTEGRATVAVGDGPHRIELALHVERQRIPLAGMEPDTVLPNSGRVQVTVPQARWAEALQQAEAVPPRQRPRK